MNVARVNVWAGSIKDEPGGMAEKLAALSNAGVDLEFIIARRDTNGKNGVLFVAPISGAKGMRVAKNAGFAKADTMGSLRVVAPNKMGLCTEISTKLAAAGINLRGYSAAALGRNAVIYLAFDSVQDSNKAVQVLQAASKKKAGAKRKAGAKKKAAPKKRATAKKRAGTKKRAMAKKKAAPKKRATAKKKAAPKKRATAKKA